MASKDRGYTDSPDLRRCSRCGKSFGSRAAADQHIAAKHKGIGERVTVRLEDESSFADLAIEAEIDHASGIHNPDYAWLVEPTQ
jgi:hypothetical protein